MRSSLIQKITYSIISTIICCGLLLIYYSFYKKEKKIQFEDLIMCTLLVAVSSLRYGVGSDYFRYLESASLYGKMFALNIGSLFSVETIQKYSYEVGYKILSVLSYKISPSPYFIFWVVSAIIYIPMVIYCRKETRDSRIAIAVYLLFGYWGISLNVIGQSIAMVLLLHARSAIDHKKYILAALLAICAESFHTTAIIAALLILLPSIPFVKSFFRASKRNLVKMIIIGIVARSGIGILRNALSRTALFSRYTRYLSTDISDIGSRVYMMLGALIETLLVIAIVYMAIKKIEQETSNNSKLEELIPIVMLGIPFAIVGISRADWLWLSIRFAEYFFVFLIALIPEIISTTDTINRRGIIAFNRKRIPFWLTMIAWHAVFAILMFNNNKFIIDTYLFK